MQIGIISDIHGDYQALQDVLWRFDHFHQVDAILCAGDLVGRGPNQDLVVSAIRERQIPTVLGNHDEWLYEVTPENSRYLQTLKVDWRGEFGQSRVFMCHGKPGNNMWGMYRDHLSATYVKMVLKSLKADVLVTGHTHMPLFIAVNEGCLVNPGSLYAFESQRESSHTYGILHLPEHRFDVYDITSDTMEPLELEYG